jgi:hypothetical protein
MPAFFWVAGISAGIRHPPPCVQKPVVEKNQRSFPGSGVLIHLVQTDSTKAGPYPWVKPGLFAFFVQRKSPC